MLMVVGEVIKRESFELFCVLELVLATKLRKQEGGGGLARRWRRKERERDWHRPRFPHEWSGPMDQACGNSAHRASVEAHSGNVEGTPSPCHIKKT